MLTRDAIIISVEDAEKVLSALGIRLHGIPLASQLFNTEFEDDTKQVISRLYADVKRYDKMLKAEQGE